MRNYWTGPLTRFGLAVAAIACLLDQASKLYLLRVVDLADHPIRLGPFFDFILTKNPGISYGLLQTQTALGAWLLLGFKAVAVVLLWLWLARSKDRLTALSLGLITAGRWAMPSTGWPMAGSPTSCFSTFTRPIGGSIGMSLT